MVSRRRTITGRCDALTQRTRAFKGAVEAVIADGSVVDIGHRTLTVLFFADTDLTWAVEGGAVNDFALLARASHAGFRPVAFDSIVADRLCAFIDFAVAVVVQAIAPLGRGSGFTITHRPRAVFASLRALRAFADRVSARLDRSLTALWATLIGGTVAVIIYAVKTRLAVSWKDFFVGVVAVQNERAIGSHGKSVAVLVDAWTLHFRLRSACGRTAARIVAARVEDQKGGEQKTETGPHKRFQD